MTYQRLPAPADGISGVWAWHSDGAPAARRYAPADGCTYLLFAFGAATNGRRELIHARLIGPRTKPFLVDERPRLCVGVRFAPGFARAAFGMPASELLDHRVDCDTVYPGAEADLDKFDAATSDMARVTSIVALARQRLQSATEVPISVLAAVGKIANAHGNVRVEALAEHIGVTRQHLARQFSAHVGMSVKQLARVKRAEAARARSAQAAKRGKVNWAVIAHEMGYCDQAHFIRDFKTLTGLTPGKWIR
jgi:AraC-like DNA-binding protein